MLALVCADVPPGITGFAANKRVAERAGVAMSEQEHMNELNMRRESLKRLLARTVKNLEYFTEQCKSNPSCEVNFATRARRLR